jgi:hypothetical protein
MEKPEGYTIEQPTKWRKGTALTAHKIYARDGVGWWTPICVPKLHTGIVAGVARVHHLMTHSCWRKENYNKPVRCIITTTDYQMWYGVHLPGECPALHYKSRPKEEATNGTS